MGSPCSTPAGAVPAGRSGVEEGPARRARRFERCDQDVGRVAERGTRVDTGGTRPAAVAQRAEGDDRRRGSGALEAGDGRGEVRGRGGAVGPPVDEHDVGVGGARAQRQRRRLDGDGDDL